MSGFRRHIMAEIANRSFIEGYCNVYNSTFTFYLNFTNSINNYTQIDVTTDSNGYWRYKLANGQKVVYLNNCFSRYSQAESNKLVSIRFSDKFSSGLRSYHNTFGNNSANTYACRNLQYVYNMRSANMYEFGLQGTFRGCTSLIEVFTNFESVKLCTLLLRTFQDCQNLKKIHGIENWDVQAVTRIEMMFRNCPSLESDSTAPFDLSGWQTNNLTTFNGLFYLEDSAANNWYNTHGWRPYSKLRYVRLFNLPNSYSSQLNFPNFYGGQDNFSIGNLSKTVTFVNADLNLQSAINILSALQDLQGGSATITFSTSTIALIQADTTAMNLVAQAQSYGWTITGF